jgi:hypothetical protein
MCAFGAALRGARDFEDGDPRISPIAASFLLEYFRFFPAGRRRRLTRDRRGVEDRDSVIPALSPKNEELSR